MTSFTIPGVCPAPRMTRSDKWKQRPCVMRYREWRDKAREAAGEIPTNVIAIHCYAHIQIPDSWSDKKKEEHYGKLHRQKPDSDNLTKAVADSLFAEDSTIPIMQCTKLWCEKGQEERMDVFLLSL